MISSQSGTQRARIAVEGIWGPISNKQARRAGQYVRVYGLGLVLVGFSVLPLLWGVSTALKTAGDLYTFPPRWVPEPITF